MAGKAKDYVDQSMSIVKTAMASLEEALNSTEKPNNKAKIQQAIDSLGTATQQLSEFRD